MESEVSVNSKENQSRIQDRFQYFRGLKLLIDADCDKHSAVEKPLPNASSARFRKYWNDMIWLELKAWHDGRTAIEQDKWLLESRQKTTLRLYDSISCFKFVAQVEDASANIEAKEESVSSCYLEKSVKELSQCYLANLFSGMKQVLKLREEMEVVENLYSSFSGLYSDHPQYTSQGLQNVLEDISIWYNACSELMLSLLSVSNLLGATDSMQNIVNVLCELKILDSSANAGAAEIEASFLDLDKSLFSSESIKEAVVRMTERQYHKHSVRSIYLRLLRNYFGCLSRSRSAIMKDTRNSICNYLPASKNVFPDSAFNSPSIMQTVIDCINDAELENKVKKFFQASCSVHTGSSDFRGLPRLEPLHAFLCSVVFGVMSECLQSRLQQALSCQKKCSSSTSLLTIQQLVSECREVIECSVLSLSVQSFLMHPLCWNGTWKGYKELMLQPFKADLMILFRSYLDFVKLLVLGQLNGLPHAPHTFTDVLYREWNFAKTISQKIGLADVCARKCVEICIEVFASTQLFLESAVHAIVMSKTKSDSLVERDSCKTPKRFLRCSSVDGVQTPSSPQAGILWFHRQRSESPHLAHRHSLLEDTQQIEEVMSLQPPFFEVDVCDPIESSRRYLFELSRAVRDMFQEVNERFVRATHYAKVLRNDLECSLSYKFLHSLVGKKRSGKEKDCFLCKLFSRLQDFGCIQVHFHDSLKNYAKLSWLSSIFDPSLYLVFVCLDSVNSVELTCVPSQLKCLIMQRIASCFDTAPYIESDNSNVYDVNLILVIKQEALNRQKPLAAKMSRKVKSKPGHQCSWNGLTAHIKKSDCCAMQVGDIAPTRDEVSFDYDMTAVCVRGCDVAQKRTELCKFFGKFMKLEVTQMSILKRNQLIFSQMQSAVLNFCEVLRNEIYAMSEHLQGQVIYELSDMSNAKESISLEINQITLRIFNIGFDCFQHATHLLSGSTRDELENTQVEHLKKWMTYILKFLPKGSGKKPKWAARGLKSLVSVSFHYLSSLSEAEYDDLKCLNNKFLNHLIGTKEKVHSRTSVGATLCSNDRTVFRSLSSHSSREGTSVDGVDKELHTINSEFPDTASLNLQTIRNSVFELDEQIDRERFDSGIIGRVLETSEYTPPAVQLNARLHSVSFRWQRGTKIGEGTFGKVYTCVNMDSGKILAMKEVQFQAHDEGRVKDILDEMANFEGIVHPNLVHYFGVEIHRDLMFIFMEYCDSGTLADISQIGLPEEMIQQYTSQIVTAVGVLHHQGIVHRDIKGTNIFLTSSGLIKLGDFGSAVRLSNRAKTMPGEISSHAGITAAYTAPEVINSSAGGYGRAADIWSVGCVVIEMATRKKPWHDHEPFQIMYKVGMGSKPPIPTNLSENGQSFIKHCLEVDTSLRWNITNLQSHPFVKVGKTIQE